MTDSFVAQGGEKPKPNAALHFCNIPLRLKKVCVKHSSDFIWHSLLLVLFLFLVRLLLFPWCPNKLLFLLYFLDAPLSSLCCLPGLLPGLAAAVAAECQGEEERGQEDSQQPRKILPGQELEAILQAQGGLVCQGGGVGQPGVGEPESMGSLGV